LIVTPDQQQQLFDDTARAMRGVSDEVKARHVNNCLKADPAYGAGVAEALSKIAS
jgi:catalase